MSKQDRHAIGTGGWREHRREIRFLCLFGLFLVAGFAVLSLRPVNDEVVEPFTAGVARASAALLNLLGEQTVLVGTVIRNPRFAVNIRNGCNGIEALLLFAAAVLAFPASWRSRLLGIAFGGLAIQGINLVRVAALFLTGEYLPGFFESSHTVVWQTVVILFSVAAWMLWASRFAQAAPAPERLQRR